MIGILTENNQVAQLCLKSCSLICLEIFASLKYLSLAFVKACVLIGFSPPNIYHCGLKPGCCFKSSIIDMIDEIKNEYEDYKPNSLNENEFLNQQLRLTTEAKNRLLNIFKD